MKERKILHFLEMIKDLNSFGVDHSVPEHNADKGKNAMDLETWPLIQVLIIVIVVVNFIR